MKTLARSSDKQAILRRLQSLRPTSQRKWGSMSAHQMVCHLCDGYQMYMGEKPVAPASMKVPRALLKWVAIWVPVPWPRGFKTAPELDQQIGGTPPVVFDADLRELQVLITFSRN